MLYVQHTSGRAAHRQLFETGVLIPRPFISPVEEMERELRKIAAGSEPLRAGPLT